MLLGRAAAPLVMIALFFQPLLDALHAAFRTLCLAGSRAPEVIGAQFAMAQLL